MSCAAAKEAAVAQPSWTAIRVLACGPPLRRRGGSGRDGGSVRPLSVRTVSAHVMAAPAARSIHPRSVHVGSMLLGAARTAMNGVEAITPGRRRDGEKRRCHTSRATPAEKAAQPHTRRRVSGARSIPHPTAAPLDAANSPSAAGSSDRSTARRARGRAIPSITAKTIASTGGSHHVPSWSIDQKVGSTTTIVSAPLSSASPTDAVDRIAGSRPIRPLPESK